MSEPRTSEERITKVFDNETDKGDPWKRVVCESEQSYSVWDTNLFDAVDAFAETGESVLVEWKPSQDKRFRNLSGIEPLKGASGEDAPPLDAAAPVPNGRPRNESIELQVCLKAAVELGVAGRLEAPRDKDMVDLVIEAALRLRAQVFGAE